MKLNLDIGPLGPDGTIKLQSFVALALQGEQGIQGPQGDTGPQGPQGIQGPGIAPDDPRLSDAREWTAATVDQAEAEAGTDTTRKAWTAQRVRQAVLGWWNSSASKTKLDGIATGATANATDAQLRDRATHTGAQAISTVTGLQGALDAKEAAGTAAAAVSSHVAAGDPHPQYTTAAEAAAAAPVQSVAGKTGAVTLAKADVGLGNVDNTSDANKPVSTAQAAAIATATAIHPFLLIGA